MDQILWGLTQFESLEVKLSSPAKVQLLFTVGILYTDKYRIWLCSFILYFVSRSSPHWQSFKVSKVHSLTLLQSLSLDFICRLQWKLLLFRRSLFASCLWRSGNPDWQWVTRVSDHHVKSHFDEVMLCSSIPVLRVWRRQAPFPCKWREINLAELMPTVENRVKEEKTRRVWAGEGVNEEKERGRGGRF